MHPKTAITALLAGVVAGGVAKLKILPSVLISLYRCYRTMAPFFSGVKTYSAFYGAVVISLFGVFYSELTICVSNRLFRKEKHPASAHEDAFTC